MDVRGRIYAPAEEWVEAVVRVSRLTGPDTLLMEYKKPRIRNFLMAA